MLWTTILAATLLSANDATDCAVVTCGAGVPPALAAGTAAPQNTVHDQPAIAFLRTLQTPSGGFIDVKPPKETPPQPSLRLTRTALRTFRLLGGRPANRDAVIRYLKACYDPQSGGFADHPGAKPDAISTAVGLMIFGELKLPVEPYVGRGLKFMNDKTEGFEQIRMVASALQELHRSVPQAKQWLTEIDRVRNPDGSYGSGPGEARTTALYVMAQLRLGGKSQSKEAVLKVLRDGQREDGGFGGEKPGDSDLEACYRIVRVIADFDAQPLHPEKLRAFIAKCRNGDGGYGERPKTPSSLHGTYYATIVRHWLAGGK
jgi:prenyltransferase beta subunit